MILSLRAPPTSQQKDGKSLLSPVEVLALTKKQSADTKHSPSNLQFQICCSDQLRKEQKTGTPRREGMPKFQLDQPIMPLDFIASPSKARVFDEDLSKSNDQQFKNNEDYEEGKSLGRDTLQSESLEELFSYSSLHNLIGFNPIIVDSQSLGYAKDARNSSSNQLPHLQNCTPYLANHDYTLCLQKQNIPGRGAEDSFSFSGIKKLKLKRSPSHNDSFLIETIGSYDIRQTEVQEIETKHLPITSNSKRQIPQFFSQTRLVLPLENPAQKKYQSLTYLKLSPDAKCNLMTRKRNQSGSGHPGAKPSTKMEILDDESFQSCTQSPLSTVPADQNYQSTPKQRKFQLALISSKANQKPLQLDQYLQQFKMTDFKQDKDVIQTQRAKNSSRTQRATPMLSNSKDFHSAFERALSKLGEKDIKTQNQVPTFSDSSKKTDGILERLLVCPQKNATPVYSNLSKQKKLQSDQKTIKKQVPPKMKAMVMRRYKNELQTNNSLKHKRAGSCHSVNWDPDREKRRFSGVAKFANKEKSLSPTKVMRNFTLQKPNSGQQFKPKTENETQRNSLGQKVQIVRESVYDTSGEAEIMNDVMQEQEMRGLLSKSLEPKLNRGTEFMLISDKLRSNPKQNREVVEAYQDDFNTTNSSIQKYMYQTSNPILTSIPSYRVNMLNSVIPAATEPCNNSISLRGGSKSHYNNSISPNDETNSQMSSCRQRRAQYHRMLTAGQVEELQRQITIEIQSNNQDAISLYTRAKLAEKQKNYVQAIEDFGKVLELDPDFFNAAYAKASCENILGRIDDAIETYNLAFKKDVDVLVVTQSKNSRLSSKRNSPSNLRLSRQGSKLFGGSQSPFRIRSIDPSQAIPNAQECIGFQIMDEKHRQSIKLKPRVVQHIGSLPPTTLSSNIIEVDSELSDKSHTNNRSNIYLYNKNAEARNDFNFKPSSCEQDLTPSFENFTHLASNIIPQHLTEKTVTAFSDLDDQEKYNEEMQNKSAHSLNKKASKCISSPNFLEVDQRETNSIVNKKSSVHSQTSTKVKKTILMQKASKPKVIKKGLKRKVKQPQPWPDNALPSTKRNSVSYILPMASQVLKKKQSSMEKLVAVKPTTESTRNFYRPTQLLVNHHLQSRNLMPTNIEAFQNDCKRDVLVNSITLIGAVNIQVSTHSNTKLQSMTPISLQHNIPSNPNVLNAASKGKECVNNKDQKEIQQPSASNSMQTRERKRESSDKQDGHDCTKNNKSSSNNKGFQSQESQVQIPHLQNIQSIENNSIVSANANTENPSSFVIANTTDLNISGPPQKASSRLLMLTQANHVSNNLYFKKTHLQNGHERQESVSHSQTQQDANQNSTSKEDMTQTYKVLSNQLLQSHLTISDSSNYMEQTPKPKCNHLNAETPKDAAATITHNMPATAIDQMPEWFMLSVSSYKMKKYGECLFAVSKVAGAISKKDRSQNVVPLKLISSDTLPIPQKSGTPMRFGGVISRDDLGCRDEIPSLSNPSNFDQEGNLSKLGQVQLGYLKAKCLYKLKRYSESLFQIAIIKQMSNEVYLLSVRQQTKINLYKAMCLSMTKQYKQAVQLLSQMLDKIAPEQQELWENMRESHFEKRKHLAKLLIQAYSYRGKANEMMQDYEQALQDFNKLIELCQFQDLPTEKLFEFMSARKAILAKIQTAKQSWKH